MTKQEVKTALTCCISHKGYSDCTHCPYKYLISEQTPFDCSQKLYQNVMKLLGDDVANK